VKALVTGGGGFVGRHLCAALVENGYDAVAAGGPNDENVDARVDIRDRNGVCAVVESVRPDLVFHLAAQSFVPESLKDPEATYEINVLGTANLAHALRKVTSTGREAHRDWAEGIRLVFASSAEVYGTRDASEMPLLESLATRAANPYAASKVAAEAILLGEAHAFGLHVIIARAFNHIGPGQSDRFAISGFATRLARIAAGGERVLHVGNLDARRDFLDVRDVVRAYIALARDGDRAETYNVCSGKAVAIRDLLGELIRIAHVPVEVRGDPALLRRGEAAVTFGSNAKLVERTGWSPEYALVRSLRDIYDDACKRAGL
jgi:GDP-4-dehydro-6-deoxy-D-mannose reductase